MNNSAINKSVIKMFWFLLLNYVNADHLRSEGWNYSMLFIMIGLSIFWLLPAPLMVLVLYHLGGILVISKWAESMYLQGSTVLDVLLNLRQVSLEAYVALMGLFEILADTAQSVTLVNRLALAILVGSLAVSLTALPFLILVLIYEAFSITLQIIVFYLLQVEL